MVEVKSSEGVVEGVEGVFSYNVLACNVTKIEESVEGLDDVSGHITLQRVHEHLGCIENESLHCRYSCYLHQGLRIISCPLFEPPALLEPLEPGEKRHYCDTANF